MGFFERFKTRRATERVEPGVTPGSPLSDDVQGPATETFEAATERYYERLAAMGIPSPSDWRLLELLEPLEP